MKIRTLGDSFNFLPQVYPQVLWISRAVLRAVLRAGSTGTCGVLRFAISYAPFFRHRTQRAAMKADIHPNYSDIKVTCSCGNEFTTRSTLGEDLLIEVCSSCHPFYTGKQKIVDTGGRVDKFRRKYGMS